MKIVSNRTSTTIPLKDVSKGDVFYIEDTKCYYIKTDQYRDETTIRVVRLETGEIYVFDEKRKVCPTNAHLVVED